MLYLIYTDDGFKYSDWEIEKAAKFIIETHNENDLHKFEIATYNVIQMILYRAIKFQEVDIESIIIVYEDIEYPVNDEGEWCRKDMQI